jgi:hypothetical protein
MTHDATVCFVNGTNKRAECSRKEATESRFPDLNEIFDDLVEYSHALLGTEHETN